jgi:beta-phosphoglucomutase-like phosphatase (HAD superfamily)
MSGAGQALEENAARYKLGLASGSPPMLIDAALNGARWRHYFAEVLSSDEVQSGKPAPEVLREAEVVIESLVALRQTLEAMTNQVLVRQKDDVK